MTETAESVPGQAIEIESFVLRSARESWDTFKTDPLLYILATLIATVVGAVSLGILAGPMIVGSVQLVQRRRRGESARLGDLRAGMSLFASSFIAFLLVAIAAAIGCMLFVIPGLLVLIAFCFAFHEIAYRNAHAADALRASFHMAKRNPLHVLLVLIGVAGLNALGGAVVFGTLVTAPFAIVWMTVAYEILSGQTPEQGAIAVAPTAQPPLV